MVRKSQELRPVMTRIPEGLRRRLEREADQNRRSMNAEIIHRLEESFQREDQGELIRRTAREVVKATAGEAVQMTLSKWVELSQPPSGTPQLSNEELARLSVDKKYEKSK
jgi:Arc-like DNA binding domain